MKNNNLSNLINFNINPKKCLDIGANTGQFYRSFKDIFSNIDEYVMIEPNPHCINKIKKIGCEFYNVGISSKVGYLELITIKNKPKSKGASFYKENTNSYANEDQLLKIIVPVTTLDILFKDRFFDFIKIDVQGSELDVIAGGETVISNSNFIMIEVSLIEYNQGAPLAHRIVSAMQKLNFYIEDIVDIHTKDDAIIQLDLLFSKKIKNHNLEKIKKFTKDLIIL